MRTKWVRSHRRLLVFYNVFKSVICTKFVHDDGLVGGWMDGSPTIGKKCSEGCPSVMLEKVKDFPPMKSLLSTWERSSRG